MHSGTSEISPGKARSFLLLIDSNTDIYPLRRSDLSGVKNYLTFDVYLTFNDGMCTHDK